MKLSRTWTFGLCLLLFCVGFLIYGDLQSIHQIYRIPDSRINNAPNARIKEELLAARDRRNREERTLKIEVGVVLAIDVILLLWVASGFLRSSNSGIARPNTTA